MHNTNLGYILPTSHQFAVVVHFGQIITFDKGVPLVNVLILGNLWEYRISHILLKLDDLDYIFGVSSVGLSSTIFP